MKYNLESVRNFSIVGDIKTMVRTVLAVAGKDYSEHPAGEKKTEQN